jgi:hypothetical protein
MRRQRIQWIAAAVGTLLVLLPATRIKGQVAVGPGRVDAPFVHVDWSGGWIHVCAPFVNLDVPTPRCWQASVAPQPTCGDASTGQSLTPPPMPSPPITSMQRHRALQAQTPIQITSRDIARSDISRTQTARLQVEELPEPPRVPYPIAAGTSHKAGAASTSSPSVIDDRPRPQDSSASPK